VNHGCLGVSLFSVSDRKNRKKSKKKAIFLETDWKKGK